MTQVEIDIDINAHIEHLTYTIANEDGVATARISFDNLGFGDMTAIKFNACGYNSFGDIVPVNGKDKFFLIIQDFKVDKNQKATNLKVKLPNADIKKLDLVESQVCYSDGSVLTYEGKNNVTFDLEKFPESEELRALKKMYDPNVKYVPKDFENGWVCSCGRFNHLDKNQCSLCGKFKGKTIEICSDIGKKKIVEECRKQDQQEREYQIAETKRKEKESLKKKIYIAIGVVVGIILIALIAYSNEMSKRTTYSSEDEMKKALEGRYTNYYEGYYGKEASSQIIIKNGKYKYVYTYSGFVDDDTWYDVEYYPKKGVIHTFEDLIVTKDGDLKDGDEIYESGGYELTPGSDDDSYLSSSYESAYTALKITVDSVTSNSSYTVCTGKVTNNGKKTYKFVTVKGSFKDSSGTTLDTDETYAVGSEGLEPEESSSFRLSVPKDYDIDSCSVSISDYD